MKKIILILCFVTVASSCGKKDNQATSANEVVGTGGLAISDTATFIGEYQILRAETNDCSNMMTIVSECNGVKIVKNGLNADEEFCNVNRGEYRTDDRDHRASDRNPGHNRNPPNPDRYQETHIVTLNGNQLTSVLKISDRVSFTNTLTLEANGVLTKVSKLKSRESRCTYQKI